MLVLDTFRGHLTVAVKEALRDKRKDGPHDHSWEHDHHPATAGRGAE